MTLVTLFALLVFCNSFSGAVVEGSGCVVVTSQPYRNPDGSFEGYF